MSTDQTTEQDNPVKYLIGKLPISMREFERRYGVSHSTMMQLNAGGFKHPLVRVTFGIEQELAAQGLGMRDELAEAYGTADFDEAYDLWKKMHRRGWAAQHAFPRVVSTGRTRPVKRWIDDGWRGPTSFAKALAVPYTMTLNWYRGARRGIPGEIRRALDDADYEWGELEDAERRWIERAVAKEQG